MSFVEIGGTRHALQVGDCVIGADAAVTIPLQGDGVLPRHVVLKAHPDGQVVIHKAVEDAVVLVNGVRLGPNPTPLLHGDKVTVGVHELYFVDERKSGSTQYVQAVDPATLAGMAKPSAKRAATAGTGGRLVSLTDGREYAISGVSFLIGRDAGCDVVLVSKSVSRRHAEIMTMPKGYVVVDSSTNGTLVNGQKIEGQQVLARGDIIQCGEHEFRFYADLAPVVKAEPAAPAASAPAASAPAAPAPAAPAAVASAPPPVPSAPVPAAKAPPAPAAPPPPAAPKVAPPAPAPAAGAAQRLSNTMHGTPGAPPPPPRGPRTGEGMAAAPAPGRSAEIRVIANIIVRSGPLKGQRYPIRVPIVNVGRAEYNDIAIPDDSVSTTHAKIQRREGIWVLIDLDSTNGTMVDGERVSNGEVPLAPGALIRFGNVQCVFEPTDDTVDAPKGSSTRMLSAIKVDAPPPGKGAK